MGGCCYREFGCGQIDRHHIAIRNCWVIPKWLTGWPNMGRYTYIPTLYQLFLASYTGMSKFLCAMHSNYNCVRKLWKFMDTSATLLSKVCNEMERISLENYLLCKTFITAQSWKYCHSVQPDQHSDEDGEMGLSVSGINGPTTEDLVSLPGTFWQNLLSFVSHAKYCTLSMGYFFDNPQGCNTLFTMELLLYFC